MKTCEYCDDTGIVEVNANPIDALICPECKGRNIPVVKSLLAACKAADRALKTLERNSETIVSTLRKTDGTLAGVTLLMFEGMKRNLSHARAALVDVNASRQVD